MKNRISVLALLLFFSVGLFAQKKMKKGQITYKVTEVKSKKAGTRMLEGMEMQLYFDNALHKLEISAMGGLIHMATISDLEKETHASLFNMMGKKVKVLENKLPKTNKKKTYKITYNRDEVKTIAGYPCYQAIMTSPEGTILTAYVTNKIKARHPYFIKLFAGLEGWPMLYTIDNNGMRMTFAAQSTNANADVSKVFDIPTDYEEKTPEELKSMMGGFDFGL